MLRVAAGPRVDRHVELGPARGEVREQRLHAAGHDARRLLDVELLARAPQLRVSQVARLAAPRALHDHPAGRGLALAARRPRFARRVAVLAPLLVRVARHRVFRNLVRRPVRQDSKRRQRLAAVARRDSENVAHERPEALPVARRDGVHLDARADVFAARRAVAHPEEVHRAVLGRLVDHVDGHALVAVRVRPLHRRERVPDRPGCPPAARVRHDAVEIVGSLGERAREGDVAARADLRRRRRGRVADARAARERAGRPHVVDVTIAFAVPRPLPAAVVRVDARRAVAGRRARRDDERRAERAREHRGLFERAF
mmetsp:Transcript_6279/g.19386  ORF Transcript_6279/g.19386 Transcript_6279/m.19386 type:complete len:314 (-) Transcript_6279:174-1115(-)